MGTLHADFRQSQFTPKPRTLDRGLGVHVLKVQVDCASGLCKWIGRKETQGRDHYVCVELVLVKKHASLLYLYDSFPLSHEGIVVYSYEGTMTSYLTIMMLSLVRTDVVATWTAPRPGPDLK